ncbi:hypothetical protein OG539_02705 [Actinacidiphila glaucinigra]|uniref:hypothetical protein n=1 Tax=Actinacidiphila glaucinigra TaxID=235986 RepID=UPI002DDB8E35|nr:hypothetical protein [Actinacidiphila glaucinigra]WSD64674.1 hypothetical protein OIE69_40145 [Actinacidiphila glaucinigra]
MKRTRRYVLAERPATPVGPLREGVPRHEEDVPVPPQLLFDGTNTGRLLVRISHS